MFRPMIVAPTLPRISSANGVLAFTSPPCSPCVSRNTSSATSHWWSCAPPIPSGSCSLWFGPATKPSSDIVMVTLTLLIESPARERLALWCAAEASSCAALFAMDSSEYEPGRVRLHSCSSENESFAVELVRPAACLRSQGAVCARRSDQSPTLAGADGRACHHGDRCAARDPCPPPPQPAPIRPPPPRPPATPPAP